MLPACIKYSPHVEFPGYLARSRINDNDLIFTIDIGEDLSLDILKIIQPCYGSQVIVNFQLPDLREVFRVHVIDLV